MLAFDSIRALKKVSSCVLDTHAAAGSVTRDERRAKRAACFSVTLLGWLDEAIRCQHGVQRLCDSTAIGCLLSKHDNELFIVDQNRQVPLGDELPIRCPDIHAILRLSVWIPVGSADDLSESIDESDMSFMPVLDLCAIRNADPGSGGSWWNGLPGMHGYGLSL